MLGPCPLLWKDHWGLLSNALVIEEPKESEPICVLAKGWHSEAIQQTSSLSNRWFELSHPRILNSEAEIMLNCNLLPQIHLKIQ